MKPIVWSDAARALFALSGPTAVSAGAGSGKTTCLVELCLRLMSGEATGVPCEPRAIVAITFTEKAAVELDERLRAAVAARADAAAPGSEDARAWLRRGHALDGMAIGTIHGFARRVLREHALSAGLDPDLEVLDEEQAGSYRREAALAAVLTALDAGDGGVQLLVAAHGGAGVERGLASVVCELVRERATLGQEGAPVPVADPSGEALVARSELLERVAALVDGAAGVTTASGRRAVDQLRALAANLHEAEREGALRAEALGLIEALAGALRGWRVGKNDAPAMVALKDEIARRCEDLLGIAADALAAPQALALCGCVADAERRYRERKTAARAVDFDDLLVATRDLLRRADGPRDELRRQIRALLVDEYQDVNRVQQEIFELLADPDDAGGPVLVGVGDVKQSIYRFRGADVSVFRGLIDRLDASPRGRVLHLSQNHRSSGPILDLVNEVSASSMQPAGGEPRHDELAFRPEDRLVPARTDGAAPACELLVDPGGGAAAERRRREAVAIADRIGAFVSGAAGVEVTVRREDGSLERRRPLHGDVAILFRRLTQVSGYEQALREAGVPCRVARGGGFYQAPEVRDLGELAATLADPEDLLAWAAVLRSPLCALGDGALLTVARLGLETLVRRDPAAVAAEVTAADPEAAAEAARLRRFLEVWAELRSRRERVPVAALLSLAIERLDLEAVHALAGPDGERRVGNLKKALALAERLDTRGTRVAELAARLRELASLPPREPEADLGGGDCVALLSIHQAKGLEWPVVFVPDLGSLPPRDARRALLDAGALATSFFDRLTGEHRATRSVLRARREAARAAAAESRRLLYVALTRARDRLVLSGESVRGTDTWRDLVERAVGSSSELIVRVPVDAASTARAGTVETPTAVSGGCASANEAEPPAGAHPRDGVPGAAASCTAIPVRIAVASPASVRIAVTRLADHARCPRRAMLRDAGIAEQGTGGGARQDDPDRATARGTLAHALLAEIELEATPLERRAQMAAVVGRRGFDPASPGVRRILADVSRFLEAPAGAELIRAARLKRLRREIPFLLRVGDDASPPCYLDGAIDALVESDEGLAVIDFKYALPSAATVQRYRLQLLAYAAAVARATRGRVAARLQFLRGDLRAVEVTPTADALRAFLREAPRLARSVHEGEGRSASPETLGRTAERCRAERCGFVERCYR